MTPIPYNFVDETKCALSLVFKVDLLSSRCAWNCKCFQIGKRNLSCQKRRTDGRCVTHDTFPYAALSTLFTTDGSRRVVLLATVLPSNGKRRYLGILATVGGKLPTYTHHAIQRMKSTSPQQPLPKTPHLSPTAFQRWCVYR